MRQDFLLYNHGTNLQTHNFCLKGKEKGKTIALRADIDALPIKEANDVDYASKNENVMHACGHDVHTSNLLGVAKILNELKGEFSGTVKFIFQPGEEKSPGGASILIKEGILQNPTPASKISEFQTKSPKNLQTVTLNLLFQYLILYTMLQPHSYLHQPYHLKLQR